MGKAIYGIIRSDNFSQVHVHAQILIRGVRFVSPLLFEIPEWLNLTKLYY